MTPLGAAIRAAMAHRDMTTDNVARSVGVDVQLVRRWLHGDAEPPLGLARALTDPIDAPGELLIRPPGTAAAAMAMTVEWDRRAETTP